MSTPNRIKLRTAGEAIVVHVERVQVSTTGKWPEVEFIGRDAKSHQPVIVQVPQKSADRQLERLGLSYAECAGYALGISRGANVEAPDKPYWNVAVVSEPVGHAEQPYREPAPEFIPGQSVRGTAPVPPPPTDADAPPDALVPPEVAQDLDVVDPLYLRLTEWTLAEIVPLYVEAKILPDASAVAAICATLYIQHNRGR